MKYICENDHTFMHTATLEEYIEESDANTKTPVCPICHSKVYDEYVLGDKQIVSVISVDIADVDSRLKEGYVVESLYAKTATLVKKAEK